MPVIEAFLRDPGVRLGLRADGARRPVDSRCTGRCTRGDELVTTIHVEDLATRAGTHFLTLRCEVADAAGEPVATTKALLVTQA